MWPVGHTSVAYLLYAGITRQRFDTGPGSVAAVLVGVGSLLPDIVDKLLAWHLGVLPTGRSLFHSSLVLVPFVLAVAVLARRRGSGEYAVAFGVGALPHPLFDAAPALWSPETATFLLWPLLPVTPYEGAPPTVVELLRSSLGDPYFLLEFLLLGLAVAVWRADGYPGLEFLFGRATDSSRG